MLLLNHKRLKQLAKLLKLNQTTLVFVLLFMKTAKSGAKYADRTFYVTKERAHGNETYVLLNNTSHNIPLGWFNVKDLNVQNLGKEVKTTQKYTVNKSNNGLSMVPWGTKTKSF